MGASFTNAFNGCVVFDGDALKVVEFSKQGREPEKFKTRHFRLTSVCLLYTSDAADE